METAKVDIRRLQTLSDCINRTIEALNQVRLSVHGGNLPYAPIGLQAAGAQLFGAYPGAFANPGAFAIAPQIMGQVPGVIPGIAHSAQAQYLNQIAGISPFGNVAQWPNVAQAAAALGNSPWNNQAWTNSALNGTNIAPFAQAGLGHTGVDQRLGNEYAYATDPYATARIAQTFPFVHWGYSPFGWPTV